MIPGRARWKDGETQKKQRPNELVHFDLPFGGGKRSSNRKAPRSEMGGLDADKSSNPTSRHRS